MGWCSGTDVFDAIMRHIYNNLWLKLSGIELINLIAAMIEAFEDHDWDCQSDSGWWDDPMFQEAYKKVHPDRGD